MKRIALDRRSFDRLIDEPEVERGIVANQDGALAAIVADRTSYLAKHALQRVALVDSRSQRVVRIDTIYGQRGGFHVCAVERLDVIPNGLATRQDTAITKIDQHGSDFE